MLGEVMVVLDPDAAPARARMLTAVRTAICPSIVDVAKARIVGCGWKCECPPPNRRGSLHASWNPSRAQS